MSITTVALLKSHANGLTDRRQALVANRFQIEAELVAIVEEIRQADEPLANIAVSVETLEGVAAPSRAD